MKLFFQVFTGACAIVLAVLLGSIGYTQYQAHLIGKAADSLLSHTQLKSNYRILQNQAAQLKKSNRSLSDGLIAAQKEIKTYKMFEASRSAAFSNSNPVSEDCLVFKSDRHMVECQNKKRWAREEFYQQYK